MHNWIKAIKKHLKRVIKLKKTPHEIALGFAIGTLISFLPTPGINILLGTFICLTYPKINKISLFGAIILWNPLFAVPTYIYSYKIGNMLFGNAPIVEYQISLFEKAVNFTRRFLVGNTIIAVSMSVIGYAVIHLITTLAKRTAIKLRSIEKIRQE